MRRSFALLVAGCLLTPAAAAAQLAAPAAQPVAPAAWSPSATVLRTADGRVRRAYRLDAWAPGDDAVEQARAFLAASVDRVAVAPGAELRVHRAHAAHGLSTVRFARYERGARVIGATVVVRVVNGRVDYVGVDGADLPIEGAHRIDAAAAEAIALVEAERALSVAPAWMPRGDRAVPVWVVDAAGQHMAQRRRVLVDAREGVVLTSRSLSPDALGRIFMSNPRSDMDVTSDVELLSLTSNDRMTGRFFRVFNCNAGARGCQPTQLAVADMNGDFLYDPMEPAYDDPFAEVHTYFHANRAAEHFRDVHGFTWACGTETLMRVFVNYTEAPMTRFDNAAYSPSSGSECGFMLFGQGAQDFSYDSDVVYHEFGHAVVDQVSELGFFFTDALGAAYDPQAVNEGVADYFAATISGDPAMAEYFDGTGLGGEGALRNLDNDLVCPNDLVGEGHFDGRIWAAAGWDLREALGVEKADALVFSTISAVSETVSFAQLAEVMTASAASLEAAGTLAAADLDVVAQVLVDRGLTGCERIVPLDDQEPHLGYSGQGQITVAAGGGIAPNRYRIDVPANATSLRLTVQRLSAGGTFRVVASTGGAPRFRPTARPPLRGDELDLDADGRILWTRGGDPELTTCETLHLAIITTDLSTVGAALFQITAELGLNGTETSCDAPDAGAAGADGGGGADAGVDGTPGGGGCGCRVGAARATPLLPALAFLALLATRRRRA